MSNPKRDDLSATVKSAATRITALPVPSLLRNPNFGRFNFEHLSDEIGRITAVAQELVSGDLLMLTAAPLEQIRVALERAHIAMTKMRDFSGDGDDPGGRYQALSDEVQAATNSLTETSLPWLGYLASRDRAMVTTHVNTLNAEAAALRDQFAKAGQEAASYRARIANLALEAENALENIRTTAATVGMKTYARIFSAEARAHKYTALFWIAASVLAVSCALIAMFWIIAEHEIPPDAHAGSIAQHVLLRVVFIAFFSYIPWWCSRNYRAERHLEIVNEHRVNALQTFALFTSATKDEATKNAVLLEATRCIFAAGQTGYVGSEDGAPTDRMLEVIKTFKGGSS